MMAADASATLTASRAELEELRAEHAEAEKRLAAFKSLTEKFRKMIDSGKLQIVLRHGRMVVKLPAGVLFASGSAELSKEGKDALREVAAILQAGPRSPLHGRGPHRQHADHQRLPRRRSRTTSSCRRRARSPSPQQLVASGMPPARLVAAGYAEHEPVRENTTEAGVRRTRRIEIVLMPNVAELPPLPGSDAGAPVVAAHPKR